jgi:hypothetical protein
MNKIKNKKERQDSAGYGEDFSPPVVFGGWFPLKVVDCFLSASPPWWKFHNLIQFYSSLFRLSYII